MSIGLVKRGAHRAFTLLEIMLAVGILGMMSLAIYRFVQTSITALRIQSDSSVTDAQYSGFANLLTAEWQSLTPNQGELLGDPFKFNDKPRDEINWITS